MGPAAVMLALSVLGADEVAHPQTTLKEAVELLKADKLQEFCVAVFTEEIRKAQFGRESIEDVVKANKEKIVKNLESAIQGKTQFGTYDGKKIALLRFKKPERGKVGMLMYRDTDRYRFGIEETVDEDDISKMKLDAE